MPVLPNSKHERFAQLVASGRTPADAYAAVGYKERTAYTCGPRLLKRAAVRARVTELQRAVAQVSVTRGAIDREFVLKELMDNALQAKQEQQFSASNRALELLGKEMGMFVDRTDHSFSWDGDPANLTDAQLEKLTQCLESQAKQLLDEKQKTDAIDITPEPVARIDDGFAKPRH